MPAIGYEYEVRVCVECNKSLTEADRVSLAVCQEAKHSILWLHLDEERARLLTLGHDRVSIEYIIYRDIYSIFKYVTRTIIFHLIFFFMLACF